MELPRHPSDSLRMRNPHLYPACDAPLIREGKRIRQERKPNKLESEWADIVRHSNCRHVHEQAIRLRLANGAWYKPDVVATGEPNLAMTCYEVKGPKGMKGQSKGFLALKMAATQWPEFRFILVWKVDGEWQKQWIEP